ncbi:MAG TPA: ATPase, T2SS/T4P/T4SS family [Candidatus Baltobacteraceae bacterium]|nr:ATPase, T2SS/T4P/T4SS family [Candidatus Baltobacteraceae bacterium]
MSATTFAFVNAKGGSGATTLCTQLAKIVRDVAVVDGDLSGRRNAAVLLDGVRTLDAARQGSAISTARISGVTLAEIAPSLESAFTVSLDDAERVAAMLEASCSIVLADLPTPFAAPVRPFAVRATRFVIVLEPTLLGVTSARTMLDELRRFGVPATRTVLVINARGASGALARSDVERALEAHALAEIPPSSDRSFAKAITSLDRALRAIAAEPRLESLLPSARNFVHDRRSEERDPDAPAIPASAPQTFASAPKSEFISPRERLKLHVHETLAKNVDLLHASRATSDAVKLAELRAQIDELTGRVLSEHPEVDSADDVAQLKSEIVNEALGLGPLEDLMADPTVTEIMVNGHQTVYVERSGRIERTGKRFTSESQLRLVIERIIAPLGRRLDESVPMVDARLPDGSRVNAIVEPLSIDGATLTIRRFGTRRLDAHDLIEKGSANEPMLDFMRACIEGRLNVVISGGTGSGKTTFLNILSSYIPERERIVTIEDAAELSLNQPHVVRLEARPANIEGRGEIKIRDLVRNSLRMRPDRIVVGECRGGEALDMLQAMNTGHDGSLTTAHANTPRDALSRLETMVMMAGFDLPVRAIREQIASAVDVVIQTARMRDGTRKVTSITEVVGMEGEIVTMQELVRFAPHGVDAGGKVLGEFQYTGVQPQSLNRFDESGVQFDVRQLSTLASAGSLW